MEYRTHMFTVTNIGSISDKQHNYYISFFLRKNIFSLKMFVHTYMTTISYTVY